MILVSCSRVVAVLRLKHMTDLNRLLFVGHDISYFVAAFALRVYKKHCWYNNFNCNVVANKALTRNGNPRLAPPF